MTEEKRPQYELAIYDSKVKARFLEVMSEQDYYREVILAKQIVENSTALQNCSTVSLRNAIINIALTGTTLNPALQEAFLVPRKGKAVLDFSYRGLIGIACSKGNVKSMNAQVVYTWDEFDFEQGTKPFIHYKMNLNPPEDIEKIAKDPKLIWDYVTCAFSTATLLDGSIDFVVLPKYKLWKIYQTSEGKDNAKMPWATWPEEQIRKTVIKYHSKTLPKQGNDRLATAISILNEHEGLEQKTNAERLKNKFEPEAEEMIECPETLPTKEPIEEAQVVEAPQEAPAEIKFISEAQMKRMFAVAKEAKWPTVELKAYLADKWGIEHNNQIPVGVYDEIIKYIGDHCGYAPEAV